MLTVRPSFGVFALRFRRSLVCAAVTLLSLIGCASASALNLTGTWSAVYHCEVGCAGANFPATDTLTQAKGSAEVTGTNETEVITGTLTGNTFVYQSSVGAYKAEGTLTVAANGLSWSGPGHDNNGTSGTYTATRELSSGALSQLGEPSACIGERKEEVAICGTSVPFGLSFAYQIQVSPDGKYAYSVAVNGGLIEYERNQANGALTPIGCLSSLSKSEPACIGEHADMEVAAMASPAAIAISPDGASVYVVTQGAGNAVVEFSRNEATGLLTKIGCITHEATSSECATTKAKGLDLPYGVTVSPDGENVYMTGFGEEAVAEFKRETGSGLLTQLGSPNEWIGDAGSGCGTAAIGLKEDIGIVVTPDNENVYVSAGATGTKGDIAAFARGAEGALTQLSGKEACISEALVPECAEGKHIEGSEDLVVSPDGKNVYASSNATNAVIELERTGSGALQELASPNECVSTETLTGCQEVKGINGAFGVAISPHGEDVYVAGAGENAVAAFERNPTSGVLDQLTGNPCVTEQATGCGDPEFNERVGLKFARRLTVSPDGTNVYVAGQADHAIAELARTVKPTVSGLSSHTGSEAGSTEVTVEGTGFAEGADVDFGSTPALNVTVNSATSITANSPAGSGSNLNVTVTNPAGTSTVVPEDEFTYTTPVKPTIGEIGPYYGTEQGGTEVTIIGTEFLTGATVRFGASSATNVTVNSGKEITAISPHGAGTVNVTVTTSEGTSAFTSGDEYKYVSVPPAELGGLGLNEYCEALGYESVALHRGTTIGPDYAYENWACVEKGGHQVLIATTGSAAPSMNDACLHQYPGKASYAYADEPNTADSWDCYEALGTPTCACASLQPPEKQLGKAAVISRAIPPPVLAHTGNVAPVSGTVLVKLPGTNTFVPLSSLRQIPFGVGHKRHERHGERDDGPPGWRNPDGTVLQRRVHPQAGNERAGRGRTGRRELLSVPDQARAQPHRAG